MKRTFLKAMLVLFAVFSATQAAAETKVIRDV